MVIETRSRKKSAEMLRSPTKRESQERKLREDLKTYRRTLQKIAKTKTKILCALREEGCPVAADLLQTPVKEANGVRCQQCAGCNIVTKLGPCLTCVDCRRELECSEHTRLCFSWRQPATTFVMGSVVTGVSSLCNVIEYDLDNYRQLVEKLGEASLEIEADLDDFPAGAQEHSNDRFGPDRRERDIRNEEEQLVVIESLLAKYQEERRRLEEVHTEDEDEPLDDAVDVGGGATGAYGLMTQTRTHYTFGEGGGTPAGVDLAGAPIPLDSQLDEDWGLGLDQRAPIPGLESLWTAGGLSQQLGDITRTSSVLPSTSDTTAAGRVPLPTFESLLAAGGSLQALGGDSSSHPNQSTTPAADSARGAPRPNAEASVAAGGSFQELGNVTSTPPSATTESGTGGSRVSQSPVDPPRKPGPEITAAAGGARPRVTINLDQEVTTTSGPTHTPSGIPAAKVAMPTGTGGTIKTWTPTTITSTVSTVFTRTTPSETVATLPSDPRRPLPPTDPPRRRASSAGEEVENPRASSSSAREKLFRNKMLVAGRSKNWGLNMAALLDKLRSAGSAGSTSVSWAEKEINNLQKSLEELEELEANTWTAIGRLEGEPAKKVRIERWMIWHEQQVQRIRGAKATMWEAALRGGSGTHREGRESCGRSAGHVEKVRLPTFSGRQEDFAEFRNQFRELCRGERYTPILEMAQLKTKLPKEALAAIAGLQCPELAWKRMEEVYGNRELAIMSTIKTLREFKSSKTATHEHMIDLATAVQKCTTELANVDALNDLLGDRESLACIIQSMPSEIKSKWYDKDVPDDTMEKGRVLLDWVELQRRNAIKVRLDLMAAKMRVSSAPSARGSPAPESTEKGLLSSAMHAYGGGRDGAQRQKSPDKEGDSSKPKTPATRIEVKTDKDAKEVAEKRKQNLVSRKLDKCPICSQSHTYERTWTTTQPPVKARLLSTHLTTCDKFLALSSDAKLAAVLSNAACLHCAAWDHSVHKFPGGKPTKDPKCSFLVGGSACGGQHGRWFHETGGSGSAHSVVATTPQQGPGLYEVYLAPIHPPGDDSTRASASGMVMVDPGSDTNFVTHEFAKSLKLQGEICHFRLKVVDRDARPLETVRYQMEVEDKHGQQHHVIAMGLDSITVLPPDPDLAPPEEVVSVHSQRRLPAPPRKCGHTARAQELGAPRTDSVSLGESPPARVPDRQRVVAAWEPPQPVIPRVPDPPVHISCRLRPPAG